MDELEKFAEQNFYINKMIRCENLEDDLLDALKQAGFELGPAQIKIIKDAKERRTNITKHWSVNDYYDDETISLVYEKEKYIIDKYNYQYAF